MHNGSCDYFRKKLSDPHIGVLSNRGGGGDKDHEYNEELLPFRQSTAFRH